MERYSGATCPYCGKPFFDEDDIVVCPECGTPHHRACWLERGACAFSAKHSEGYFWQQPAAETHENSSNEGAGSQASSASSASAASGQFCPRCGNRNPAGCIYCEKCGAPLPQNDGSYAYVFPYEPILDNEMIDGVPAKDIAVFVGDNPGYFLPRFKMFSKGHFVGWNWSSFFFFYFYLFYRKMYSFGFLVMFANIILSLPSMALYLVDYQTLLINNGLLDQMFFTLSNPKLAVTFSGIAWVLMWVLRGFVMLFTNRLYYSHTLDAIRHIREQKFENDDAYFSALIKKGHTNRTAVIVIAAVFMALYFLSAAAAAIFSLSM